MFRSNQIISATTLIKKFSDIALDLKYRPQAVLITQKSGLKLVLLNVEIYEELLDFRMHAEGPIDPTPLV